MTSRSYVQRTNISQSGFLESRCLPILGIDELASEPGLKLLRVRPIGKAEDLEPSLVTFERVPATAKRQPVPANALISRITDRMPAILPRETWSAWLGETWAPLDEIKALLKTFEDGGTWTMTEQPTRSRASKPPKPPRESPPQQTLF